MDPASTRSGLQSAHAPDIRVPFEPLSLFESFLRALADPAAGASLYHMHAPDAVVRCGPGVGRAAAIDRDEFSALHRAINLQYADFLPRFAGPRLLQSSGADDPEGCVSWFEITEIREQRTHIAALGTQVHQGALRVGWATLSPGIQSWSYSHGYRQSLADYPWMRISTPARARALIDASHFRRYGRSTARIVSLPDAKFACQMSTVCCKHDFEIALPAEAQLLIDAMPWDGLKPELRGTRLPHRPDGKLQLKELNETCRFLGALGQCLIHQSLGRQPFGPCCVFPVAFAETPEGIAAALSPICDSTRHGVGPALRDREDDLRERLVHAEPKRADGFRLFPGAQIPWENFREIETALCDILSAEEWTFRRRLYVGCRLLGALRDREAVEVDRWVAEPMQPITVQMRKAIHDMLARILAWDRATLRSLPRDIPPQLSGMEIGEPRVLARVLQNTLFAKTFSYPFDLTTAHNFLIVLYLLALLMQESASIPLPERMWRELGALGVHGLLKSVLHEGVPEGFRQVFGQAEFGMWMLSA